MTSDKQALMDATAIFRTVTVFVIGSKTNICPKITKLTDKIFLSKTGKKIKGSFKSSDVI